MDLIRELGISGSEDEGSGENSVCGSPGVVTTTASPAKFDILSESSLQKSIGISTKNRLKAFSLPAKNALPKSPLVNCLSRRKLDTAVSGQSTSNNKSQSSQLVTKMKDTSASADKLIGKSSTMNCSVKSVDKRSTTTKEVKYTNSPNVRSELKFCPPKSWLDLKSSNIDFTQIQKMNMNRTIDDPIYKCDFRNQLLFKAPSIAIKEITYKDIKGESKTVNTVDLRFTHSIPKISYSCKPQVQMHLTRSTVYETISTDCQNLIESLYLHNTPEMGEHPRWYGWYPKEPFDVSSIPCKHVNKSYSSKESLQSEKSEKKHRRKVELKIKKSRKHSKNKLSKLKSKKKKSKKDGKRKKYKYSLSETTKSRRRRSESRYDDKEVNSKSKSRSKSRDKCKEKYVAKSETCSDEVESVSEKHDSSLWESDDDDELANDEVVVVSCDPSEGWESEDEKPERILEQRPKKERSLEMPLNFNFTSRVRLTPPEAAPLLEVKQEPLHSSLTPEVIKDDSPADADHKLALDVGIIKSEICPEMQSVHDGDDDKSNSILDESFEKSVVLENEYEQFMKCLGTESEADDAKREPNPDAVILSNEKVVKKRKHSYSSYSSTSSSESDNDSSSGSSSSDSSEGDSKNRRKVPDKQTTDMFDNDVFDIAANDSIQQETSYASLSPPGYTIADSVGGNTPEMATQTQVVDHGDNPQDDVNTPEQSPPLPLIDPASLVPEKRNSLISIKLVSPRKRMLDIGECAMRDSVSPTPEESEQHQQSELSSGQHVGPASGRKRRSSRSASPPPSKKAVIDSGGLMSDYKDTLPNIERRRSTDEAFGKQQPRPHSRNDDSRSHHKASPERRHGDQIYHQQSSSSNRRRSSRSASPRKHHHGSRGEESLHRTSSSDGHHSNSGGSRLDRERRIFGTNVTSSSRRRRRVSSPPSSSSRRSRRSRSPSVNIRRSSPLLSSSSRRRRRSPTHSPSSRQQHKHHRGSGLGGRSSRSPDRKRERLRSDASPDERRRSGGGRHDSADKHSAALAAAASETLLQGTGMLLRSPRSGDGSKCSVAADSTISDDLLLPPHNYQQSLRGAGGMTSGGQAQAHHPHQNHEYHDGAIPYPGSYYEGNAAAVVKSPKRLSLDDRINQVLGLEKGGALVGIDGNGDPMSDSQPRQITTTYDARGYSNADDVPRYHESVSYPGYENESATRGERRVSANRVVQVLPTATMPPQSSPIASKQLKVLQVGNMLQIVPDTSVVGTAASVNSPKSMTSQLHQQRITTASVPSSTLQLEEDIKKRCSAAEEALKQKHLERKAAKDNRRLERERRRKEKERKRKERDRRRQLKQKKTDELIKKALLLETEGDMIDEELQSHDTTLEGFDMVQWPPQPKIAGKSILAINRHDELFETKRRVKFADGIVPGEGTSPSAGEELSSPPPSHKKRTVFKKEKRYSKNKLLSRKLAKKKVKVKVVQSKPKKSSKSGGSALSSSVGDTAADSDLEFERMAPPSPPPGSPPPHIFPSRVKVTAAPMPHQLPPHPHPAVMIVPPHAAMAPMAYPPQHHHQQYPYAAPPPPVHAVIPPLPSSAVLHPHPGIPPPPTAYANAPPPSQVQAMGHHLHHMHMQQPQHHHPHPQHGGPPPQQMVVPGHVMYPPPPPPPPPPQQQQQLHPYVMALGAGPPPPPPPPLPPSSSQSHRGSSAHHHHHHQQHHSNHHHMGGGGVNGGGAGGGMSSSSSSLPPNHQLPPHLAVRSNS